MSEQNRHGKREAAPSRPSLRDYWSQHRDWVAGLSRGQRIRYRLFQVLVVICALIIALFLALRPELVWLSFLCAEALSCLAAAGVFLRLIRPRIRALCAPAEENSP